MSTEPAGLDTTLDFTADGEYADHDEVKVVMTRAQLAALRDTILCNVDDDTVRYDNDEPQRADFLRDFAEGAGTALGLTTTPI